MNKGQQGRHGDTCDVQKMLIFEAVPGARPRAHFAHRFLHTHTKIDNRPSIDIYTYSIIYIYNIIIINYIYSIYIIYSICDIPRIYNILCNIKNRWTRWACGRTAAKTLSINGFGTFANAPIASTRPHFFDFSIKDNTLNPDIPAFYCGCRAFLTIRSKKLEVSTFFSLVLRFISERRLKILDIPAFSSWFQRLSHKNNLKDLIFQVSYKTETIHISKSNSCIKIQENNNDK
jgi:hypothetical protein